jgi:hypothetical protein
MFSHAIVLPLMPATMLLLFYGYQLILPENLTVDIMITFIVVALGQLMAYVLTVSKLDLSCTGYKAAAMIIVLTMLAVFIILHTILRNAICSSTAHR